MTELKTTNKKVLVIYDGSNTHAKRVAQSIAKNYEVKAQSPKVIKKMVELMHDKNIIISVGHGYINSIGFGSLPGTFGPNRKILKSIITQAKLESDTRLIFHHCSSAGQENGKDNILAEISKKFPELEIHGNTASGEGVLNPHKIDLRNGIMFPEFIRTRFMEDYPVLEKKDVRKATKELIHIKDKNDRKIESELHLLYRELPNIGYDRFGGLISENSLDDDLSDLRLNVDALNKLKSGINIFKNRYHEIAQDKVDNIMRLRAKIASGEN